MQCIGTAIKKYQVTPQMVPIEKQRKLFLQSKKREERTQSQNTLSTKRPATRPAPRARGVSPSAATTKL
eukprot:Awhi_evm1s5286